MTRVKGADLRVGDTIEVGYERRDTITGLRPYNGLLKHLWKDGAQLADLALSKIGCTISNSDLFTVFNR